MSAKLPHAWSGAECLVAHFGPDGSLEPPCRRCARCHQWIRPTDFETLTCEPAVTRPSSYTPE